MLNEQISSVEKNDTYMQLIQNVYGNRLKKMPIPEHGPF